MNEFINHLNMKIMKKINLLLMAFVSLFAVATFAACSKDNYPQDSDSDSPPPHAHAASDKTWVIESADRSIKQIWSADIQIPECNKEDFDGGYIPAKADCRSYIYEGNTYYYYSWPYVNQHAGALCPAPWRVPSKEDFRNLCVAISGTDEVDGDPEHVLKNYVQRWGAELSGMAGSNLVSYVGSYAQYWSLTAYDDEGYEGAYILYINNAGFVFTVQMPVMFSGQPVRCVK
jgi:uncharacterized protein (TIGR02145 family)